MDGFNCLAVVSSQTYNSDGIMFEYTQSRHHPSIFRFQDNAVRTAAARRRNQVCWGNVLTGPALYSVSGMGIIIPLGAMRHPGDIFY